MKNITSEDKSRIKAHASAIIPIGIFAASAMLLLGWIVETHSAWGAAA